MPPTIHAAAEQIRAGSLSPIDLLEQCLERIDAREEGVRAWVLVDRPGAREQAAERAAELRRGQWRGPLHGIPLAIKDIFDVFDWPTAAGSRRWAQSVARHDSTVVRKLREAGAVLVGKTVTTQYASFDPSPTRNPWNPSRTPGGSSSGSAAAVACGMCLGALASQTGGSITRPGSYCGVASCKPTYGRCSSHGVLPLAPSLDHVGAMARCVKDVALMLQAIAGPDWHDPTTLDEPVPDYESGLAGASNPPVLGRLHGLFDDLAEPVMKSALEQAAKTLADSGATVVDVALPASFSEVLARHRVVMAVEAAVYHEDRLRRHPEDYGPCITQLLQEGLRCPAAEYARCKDHQQRLREEVQSCLDGVDALLCPATTGPAPDASTTGNPAFNSPWSYTGLPAVAFAMGWSPDRLPLGLQLVGRPWGEGDLLAVAAWCERVLGVEVPLA